MHEIAQDYGLESFSVGKGEERFVCVCSRPPTHSELTELRGLKKNEGSKVPLEPEPCQQEQNVTKNNQQGKQTCWFANCYCNNLTRY